MESHFLSRRLLKVSTLLCLSPVLAYGKGENGNSNFDVFDYIDPFIGTSDGGHSFPGATLPFGMVKAVADTDGANQGGFASDASFVTGFSHTHDSGTGGPGSMGNFPIFIHPACPDDNLTKCSWQESDRSVRWDRESTKAQPGFFSISLNNGVHAEMTVTNHSALYRFSFPEAAPDSLNPVVLVDMADLHHSRHNGTTSVDPHTGRFTGSATFEPSYGVGTYRVHFCADFHGPSIRDTGIWLDDEVRPGKNTVSLNASGSGGAFARFTPPQANGTMDVRVGISFISATQACSNAEKEQPNFDFEDTVARANAAWKEKMGVISLDTSGVSTELQTVFWSGIYRTMISPQDYTGENPLWKSDEPYYDSFYCIWDSFRGIHQLITLVDPLSQSRMVRSLVDIYRHEGYLPDCRMSFCKGLTQGGSNADVLIAEAYLKGIPDVDWDTAYRAVVKDAEVEPENFNVEGRGSLQSWKSLGYIPIHDSNTTAKGLRTRSISRTVEYAYDDFCIAQMAKSMGHDGDYKKYMKRATNWENVFKPNQTSSWRGSNFTGFLQPRNADGTWAYQDPMFCGPYLQPDACLMDENAKETYEGSSWLYTFYVPQDMAKLIRALGGRSKFIDRLSFFHDSGLLNMGNEQAFLPVFQFHYAGRPALSTERAHSYIPRLFNTSVGGLPGNDDSGAMGAFAVFSMLGLYPVHGQDVYLISAPFFKEASIRNRITGNVATIRNINFDPLYKSIYIQNVTRDGKPWTRNWIGHDFFIEGGTLEITLGDKESNWGTRIEDLPPSMSEYRW
ncbi:alpha-12-mannosidase [Aspergillus oryzae]|uniref:Alpha-12-mannosidase n=1 Tax=Aspergillus oryzae TaxID=5062 RepID=A0A1S9D972_ASPOZ|nr:alpha-12-mannosidase [Aspergillus oryzae]